MFDQNSASNKKCCFHSTDHFLICAELFYKLCKKRCKHKIKTLISIRGKCHQVDFRPCSNQLLLRFTHRDRERRKYLLNSTLIFSFFYIHNSVCNFSIINQRIRINLMSHIFCKRELFEHQTFYQVCVV